MYKKNKCLDVILIGLMILTAFSGSHAQTVFHDEISITIPRGVIIPLYQGPLCR